MSQPNVTAELEEENSELNIEDDTPLMHTLDTPEKESVQEEEREMLENMSNLLLNEEANETISNENADLATEDTVNYSNDNNNTSVSRLIEYFEENDEHCGGERFGALSSHDVTLAESPSKVLNKSSHFVMINCREGEISQHQRRSLDELSSITVSYDWKDVSQLRRVTLESTETTVEIPPSILALTNMELKDRLMSLGEKPGPISDTTRRVYQKHLVKIEHNVDHKNKVEDFKVTV